MRLVRKLAIAVMAVCLCPWSSIAGVCEDPVETAAGKISGTEESGACAWKGIPFAAPPVGDLRWKAPAPVEPHAGILEAVDFGPSCMQHEGFLSGGSSPAGVSEDCLTLNVWSPPRSGEFPVMYWIYGGGFTSGGSSYGMYNGAKLAALHDVVIVSVNYRVNVFGFLAHPDLAKEDPNGSTGNYGIMDQIAGLLWVKQNIAAFNGDPDNVTIFGESAGGISVCGLLAAPPAAGLFHRAIMESGGCDLTLPMEEGLEAGQALAEDVGCAGADSLECLRDTSAEKLLKFGEDIASSHVDGYVFPDMPIEVIRRGEHNRAPVLMGNNKNEFNLFLIPTGILAEPGFMVEKRARRVLGDSFQEGWAMYPRSEYGRPAKRYLALTTDVYVSRGFQAAEALSAHDPVYVYSFDWEDYFGAGVMGAFHALEVPFVFGNFQFKLEPMKLVFWNEKTKQKAEPLSRQMMKYWTNFAKTGDPNEEGMVEWPAYNTQTRERIHFNTKITTRPLESGKIERYSYWADKRLTTPKMSE